jgi:hypothetical protein
MSLFSSIALKASSVLSGAVKAYRMLDDARSFMSENSSKAKEFVEVLAPIARKFGLRPPDNSNLTRLIESGKGILSGAQRKMDSASNELARLENLALRNGLAGEGIRSAARRLKDDGQHWQDKASYEKLLVSTTEADEIDDVDLALKNVRDLMYVKPSTQIMISNGGTIDVAATSTVTQHLTGSSVYESGGAAITGLCTNGFSFFGDAGSATLESAWWKTKLNHNTVAVGFYYDGSNAFAVHPSFTVTLPSGVPQGRLVVKGNLEHVGHANIASSGTAIGPVAGLSLGDSDIAVSDGVGDYWTWTEGDNEGYRYQRRINKAVNASHTTTISCEFVEGSAAGYAIAVFEVLFKPDSVMLRDMDSMNVDVDEADPISRHIELVQAYNQYLLDMGNDDLVTLLNARLGTNYTSDVIYPTNWNSTSFESFGRFIDEYCLLMQNFTMQIKRNHEFLSH